MRKTCYNWVCKNDLEFLFGAVQPFLLLFQMLFQDFSSNKCFFFAAVAESCPVFLEKLAKTSAALLLLVTGTDPFLLPS